MTSFMLLCSVVAILHGYPISIVVLLERSIKKTESDII